MDGADGADRYLHQIQNRGSDLGFAPNSLSEQLLGAVDDCSGSSDPNLHDEDLTPLPSSLEVAGSRVGRKWVGSNPTPTHFWASPTSTHYRPTSVPYLVELATGGVPAGGKGLSWRTPVVALLGGPRLQRANLFNKIPD